MMESSTFGPGLNVPRPHIAGPINEDEFVRTVFKTQ